MISRVPPRLHRTTALLAPFVVCGLLGQTPHAARAEDAPPAAAGIRVSPGDVVFSISPAGSWKFATRSGRSLVELGSLVIFTTGEDGKLTERLNSASGTQSLLPPGGVNVVQEGAPGGARRPSSRADDDNDGKIDEDPLDRVDNDHDGRIDEDFAAVGDAMAVVKYAMPGGVVSVRQEVYAWSLSHIDHMAASTCFVRNNGHEVLHGVRVGVNLVPGEAIAGNRLLAHSRQSSSGGLGTVSIMLRGNDESLTMLLMARESSDDTEEWNVRDDGETVFALSPPLGDLAPGEMIRLHLAFVVSTPDETQTTRAIQAARRTLLGDGTTRMIPPPVSLTPRDDTATLDNEPDATPGIDAYWLRAGKLDEVLLGGSPNPFRDATTIEYEVPSRVIDEDGIEHTISDASLSTSVKVYNVTGRLIATLVDNPHAPGRYRTGWTAQSDTGGAVASGVYYVKLTIGKRSVTKRLVQLK